MATRWTWLLAATSLLAVSGLTLRAAGTPAPAPEPVLLELFTSQGCSSCPPADHLLSQLGSGGEAGPVVALAFHVDYWNSLGWTDPFSSPRWSARQEDYAKSFGSNRIYTPQLVVNGRRECVGSQRPSVLGIIKAAHQTPPAARVTLRVQASPAGAASLHVRATFTPVHATAHPLELWVALTQSGLMTPVKAGENAATTLHDDFVVRRLERVPTPVTDPTGGRGADLELPIEPGWTGPLTVVAFAQDAVSRAIEGVAVAAARR